MKKSHRRGDLLAVASHLLSAVFPFVAATSLQQMGVLKASFLFYCIATVFVVFFTYKRVGIKELYRALERNRSFLWAITFFVGGAIAYYGGLASTKNVLAFVLLSRLDWVMQIPVAIVLLREKARPLAVVAAILACCGAVLVGWTSRIDVDTAVWALIYVGLSVVAYTLTKPLLRTELSADSVLALRAYGVTLILGIMNACSVQGLGGNAFEVTPSAILAGVMLATLFATRFSAISSIPLWRFAAYAPIQAFVAVLISTWLGQAASFLVIMGMLLIAVGEGLVAIEEYGKSQAT
ncbi:MAG: EamA family transporter [SAR324 cluster bacterium]|uniref:EamA family transporter n=1 Tax=SAR324 cluster bacterium TaxID=2024889 RepID=A0A7X9FT36_9DELT|nr:EamA family transporter [SAR324 cluster bacterium]